MDLTPLQVMVHELFDRSDFVPFERWLELRKALNEEGNEQTLGLAASDFMESRCRSCGVHGLYRRRFLGRLVHRPGCGFSWHVSPITYAGIQLRASVTAGLEIGSDSASEDERKGRSGCLGMAFGFVLGLMLRLPIAILMIPIQTMVYLLQRKPEEGANAGPQPGAR